MKKVQEMFKQHGDWLSIFGIGMILWALMVGFFLGLVGPSSYGTYIPFHDLKTVRITNVIYSDNDSDAYVEGMTGGNRKIHIDVDNGKIPSNFKNTKTAVVYETADKGFYLNQKDYDEENPKVSKQDVNKLRMSLIGTMAVLGIAVNSYIAMVSTKNTQNTASRTN